ncbi:peroxidase 57-like [Solanum dulcamara]|uniref:peroxidase 57-like n=1 Tax=Solanum dulcamara TaxID=45834 RepID=UPI0024852B75|nr:peroxidase 57-like [Solanum dulcamara]
MIASGYSQSKLNKLVNGKYWSSMNIINASEKMAAIFAGFFLICIILPSLASAFVDHLPEVVQADESDKNDVPIHVNNVAHFSEKEVKEALKKRAKAVHDLWEQFRDHDENAAPVEDDPTPNPVPVDPTPNPVPVNPTPNLVPVNNVPAGYPGATQAPVTMGYGGAPITPNPSDQQATVPEQPGAVQNHPTPEEIKEHRKHAGLQVGFYDETCPNAEKIIKDGMIRAFGNDSSMAAPIPRLLLHDCFVNGCDASLFLDQTPSGARIEKLATPNGPTVRGFELIDEIKAELEAECPGIVSCADLLAYLSRDAFVVSGVPHYDVPGGRRDGMESLEANVLGNLPLPDNTVDKMIDLFKKKGLNEEDLVVLIGAHSIGVAHCFSFRYRLDDPQKATMVDPRLAGVMRFTCTSPMSTVAFDTTTQYKMDSIYYKQLAGKRGLLESDELLNEDPRTKDFIQKFGDDEMGWFNKLGKAMNKLASIQVLTGDQGQIRKQCRSVN